MIASSPTPPSLSEPLFLRQTDVLRLIGVSRSTLWRMIARGDFPDRVKLSSNISAWSADDVVAWAQGVKANNSN